MFKEEAFEPFENKEDLLFIINKLSKAVCYKQALEKYTNKYLKHKLKNQTFEQLTAGVPEITLENLFIDDEVDALLESETYFNGEHYFIDTEKEEILWM